MDQDIKTGIKVASAIIAVLFTYLFCCTYISPGIVGVVVNMLGDKKGIEDQELTVGITFTAPWKKIYKFPIFEQNHTWVGKTDGFSFQTSEGLSVSADVGITFHLEPKKIHLLFCKYRRGMGEITHTFIRNYVRDAVNRISSKMKIEDLYGLGKESFFESVEEIVKRDLAPLGVSISRIYLIGSFRFSENVVDALNQKIEAIQRAQQRENELREAEAQAKKEIAQAEGNARCIAIDAGAKAEANKLLSKSLTPEIISWNAIQKWDGKLPKVSGANTSLIYDFMKLNK